MGTQLQQTLSEKELPPCPEITPLLERSEQVLSKSADLLQRSATEAGENIQLIDRKIQQIGDLIKLHRNDAESPMEQEQYPLKLLIEDALSVVREALNSHQAAVNIEIDESLPRISVPRNQLMQMLIHMLRNSIDAIQMQ